MYLPIETHLGLGWPKLPGKMHVKVLNQTMCPRDDQRALRKCCDDYPWLPDQACVVRALASQSEREKGTKVKEKREPRQEMQEIR